MTLGYFLFERSRGAQPQTIAIEYCNAVLANLPASTLAPVQGVLNAAVGLRLVMNLGPSDHVMPALYDLH